MEKWFAAGTPQARSLTKYARLTEAAFGRVLKTLGTVMSRMGIDTSVWRHLQGCAELLQNISR